MTKWEYYSKAKKRLGNLFVCRLIINAGWGGSRLPVIEFVSNGKNTKTSDLRSYIGDY